MTDLSEQIVRCGHLKMHARKACMLVGTVSICLLYFIYGFAGDSSNGIERSPTDFLSSYVSQMTSNMTSYPVGNGSLADILNGEYKAYLESANSTVPVEEREAEMVSAVRKVRLYCIILTMEKDLHTKVKAVNKTWAKRCDKHFYVIHSHQHRADFLNVNVPDDRKLLIRKVEQTYKLIYERYINDFDYLLKGDDDTYIVVENLKYLLWHYNPNEPGYLGFHFNKFVERGYMSGGAGYVISNRGIRHLVERGYNNGLCQIVRREDDPENSEDIETSRCLEASGVPVWSSLDKDGRETFHPYPLEKHLLGSIPAYVYSWAFNPVKQGKMCCARYVVSFHYMTPESMLFIDHLLYDTTVFSLHQGERLPSRAFDIGPVNGPPGTS